MELHDIATSEIVVEPVLNGPYGPCFYLLCESKVLAVVYWDDDSDLTVAEEEGLELPWGWCMFLAARVADRESLASGASPTSAEVALAEARERVAASARSHTREGLVGLEDLSPKRLPWRVLSDDE